MTTTIGAFRRSIPDRVELTKKLAAFHVWNGVTLATPVDTGRARAAWNMAVGSADLSVPPEGRYAGPTPPAIGAIPPGAPVIVSNNLPYIAPLNNGHSQQAPAGFVERVVQDTLAAFGDFAAEAKAEGERRGGR